MRESHMEQVERWARFVREHPDEWRKPHTEFINALFQNHERVLKELLRTKEGKGEGRVTTGRLSKAGLCTLEGLLLLGWKDSNQHKQGY